jgi:hypothetical protein
MHHDSAAVFKAEDTDAFDFTLTYSTLYTLGYLILSKSAPLSLDSAAIVARANHIDADNHSPTRQMRVEYRFGE